MASFHEQWHIPTDRAASTAQPDRSRCSKSPVCRQLHCCHCPRRHHPDQLRCNIPHTCGTRYQKWDGRRLSPQAARTRAARTSRSSNERSGDSGAASDRKRVVRGSCVTRPVDPPSGVRIARRLRPEGAEEHGQVAAERCSHDSGTTGGSRMRNEQCTEVASPRDRVTMCQQKAQSRTVSGETISFLTFVFKEVSPARKAGASPLSASSLCSRWHVHATGQPTTQQ